MPEMEVVVQRTRAEEVIELVSMQESKTLPGVKPDVELLDVMVGNATADPRCEIRQVGKVQQIVINRGGGVKN